MGSLTDQKECPKCGEESFNREYHYRTGEEFCFCSYCGYSRNLFLKRDENRKLIYKVAKQYDLRKEKILFAMAIKTSAGFEIFNSTPVLPGDTDKEIEEFLNIHLCYEPYTKSGHGRVLPDRFKMFAEKPYHAQSFLLAEKEGVYEQLWYITWNVTIKDGILEIHKPDWEKEEHGGHGVIKTKDEHGTYTYGLKEGVIPELTDDIVFATAVIDGKLTVLKNEA